MTTEDILGFPIAAGSRDDCICEVFQWVLKGEACRYFVCANPHSLEVARTDPLFREALRSASLSVPDGIGIVLASRALGGAIRERVTGSDLFLGLSRLLDQRGGHRYFFLGSTEATLGRISRKMQCDFPGIDVAGTCSPPFRAEFSDEESRLMVGAVNRARPDVLWVGMTAPKQEKWVYRHKDELDVKCIGTVGAVFDFFSGAVKRPPPFFQRRGLEWLLRLLREPRRLWRRNIVSSPAFLMRVAGRMIWPERTVPVRDGMQDAVK